MSTKVAANDSTNISLDARSSSVSSYARQRLASVPTRPTTVMANKFLAGSLHWSNLPVRIQQLDQDFCAWAATKPSPYDQPLLMTRLSRPFRDNDNNGGNGEEDLEWRRMALMAAVTATMQEQELVTALTRSFTSLFRACLDEQAPTEDANKMYQSLRLLGWLPTVVSRGEVMRPQAWLVRPLEEAVRQAILLNVRSTIQGDYETKGLLEAAQEWTLQHVQSWVVQVLRQQPTDASMMQDDDVSSPGLPHPWSEETLRQWTAQAFGQTRLEEIFDLVADYPDSHTAVTDLRHVLETLPKLRIQLATTLREALVRRLNHPGADTTQIIDVYINTIKVLRVIDPSDRLLAVVAEPVRTYLRGRTDTVRCMIGSLTNAEVGGDLYQELRRQDAKPLEHVTADSDDDEECPDMHWQPPPSIHKPRGTFLQTTRSDGEADILAMLVSIYGSQELFVNEYRLMLADKLLTNLDYNTDQHVHTLELLKLRFGELSMRSCEVMLKDLDDSKRSNANIRSVLESSGVPASQNVVDATMISHIFWAKLASPSADTSFKHHPQLQYMLDTFGTEYARLKNPRKLLWYDQLGTVQLELEVEDDGGPEHATKTKEFSCSPLLATLMMHFQDSPQRTAQELSNETGLPEHVVQKQMSFWINHRVVKILPAAAGKGPVYVVAGVQHFRAGDIDVEGAGASGAGTSAGMMETDEGTESLLDRGTQQEEMDVYLSYIVGMLTNLGALSLKTIHNNLKNFVRGSDVKYNKTPQQLSAFLQQLCKQERLECGPDGMYKLFKK